MELPPVVPKKDSLYYSSEESDCEEDTKRNNADPLSDPGVDLADSAYTVCLVSRVDLDDEIFNKIDIEANYSSVINGSSSAVAEGEEECRICLEILNEPLQLDCGHEFCKECVSQHCHNQKLLPILCPEQTCQYSLPVRMLHLILGDDLIDLVKHYKERNSNDGLKRCPFCRELLRLPCSPTTKDLRCGNCDRTFCRTHDTEHTNTLCKDYVSTIDTIDSFSKPCSHCGTNLQKSGGCDHVVCKYCNGDMCWACGTHEYLTGTVRKKCSKCGFNLLDYRYLRIHRRRLLLWMPLIFPLSILYAGLASLLFVLSCCFFGCCFCGQLVSEQNASFRRGVLTSLTIIFIPFIALFSDFGVHFAFLAEVFPPEQPHREIPFLKPNSDDDDDDDNG